MVTAPRQRSVLNLGEPAEALSANRDHSMVVVVGRQIMKVFDITKEEFVEKHNLRQQKRRNLTYSASNVAWSPVEDHIIATTSTNGYVVIWNLEKSSKDKIEKVYMHHSRAATKVCFHRSDPNIVISGSKDAIVYMYDLRTDSPVSSFSSGGSESVRDMQFGLHIDQQEMFVVADESGHVCFWEMRKTDRPLKKFPAHQNYVASVDLHPNPLDKNLLATGGGRDKFIRVWDWSKQSPEKPIYAVETSSSVARVYWRPQRKWHIASCSVINDCAINIWDIRRPFIPFASFEEHHDTASDMVWWPTDPHSFVSTGKDGLLILHSFTHAHRPLDYCNEVAVDISPLGEISFAVSQEMKSKSNPKDAVGVYVGVSPRAILGGGHVKRSDPFGGPISSHLYSCAFKDEKTLALSTDWFVESARRYRLNGLPLAALCDFNAAVAIQLDRPQIAQTWLMLKTLFDNIRSPNANQRRSDAAESASSNIPEQRSIADASSALRSTVNFGGDTPLGPLEPETEDEAEMTIESARSANIGAATLHAGPLATTADFFFGSAELNTRGVHSDDLDSLILQHQDWQVKHEAFEPRTDDLAFRTSDEPIGTSASNGAATAQNRAELIVRRPNILTVSREAVQTPTWDPLPLVKDVLINYAESGDVQMSVCMLMVLGERGKTLIDQFTQTCWHMEYLELLDHFQLWTSAAAVIKQCWIPAVNGLSQEGTSQALCCGICQKPTGEDGWKCTRCQKCTGWCSVCQQPVRGLWAWCQVCAHGGHVDHIMDWFAKYSACPTGCGHKCQMRGS